MGFNRVRSLRIVMCELAFGAHVKAWRLWGLMDLKSPQVTYLCAKNGLCYQERNNFEGFKIVELIVIR